MTQKTEPKKAPADRELQNEGEGSRSAARRYGQGAEQTAKDPEHVNKAAQEARKALNEPEGEKLREAEARGKRHQHR